MATNPLNSRGLDWPEAEPSDSAALPETTKGKKRQKKSERRLFYFLWHTVNLFLFVSLAFLAYGIGWEASTRSYLHGFSDAVIPAQATPEQKVDSILSWMAHGPARNETAQVEVDQLAQRDPEETLNYTQLLRICGTATNAFVNLAATSGLRARRILLLDADQQAKHVSAEVFLDGRWVVVDPTYRVVLRDSQGRMLTKEQLRDAATFRDATQSIPGYPPSYSYEQTVIVRLKKLPMLGTELRPALNWIAPGWEEDLNWTLLLERESFALLTIGALLSFGFVLIRLVLAWYCDHQLCIARRSLRARIVHAGVALLTNLE